MAWLIHPCALLCAWTLALVMQPSGEPPPAAELLPPPIPAPAPQSVNNLPLPPGSVVVVLEDLKHALHLMQAKWVLLAPDQHQALMDKIQTLTDRVAELERKAGPAKKTSPIHRCVLQGTVEGDDFIDLRAELHFRTAEPDAVVPIGFKGMKLTGATLEPGGTPIWGPDLDGFSVQVKEAQSYTLVLTMKVKLAREGTTRRLDVDLPTAAITTLEATFPGRVREVLLRETGQRIATQPVENTHSRVPAGTAIGSPERLDLSWQAESGEAVPTTPLATVQGISYVMVDERLETETRLNVRADRSALGTLRFRVGALDEVRLPIETEPRGDRERIRTASFDEKQRLLTVELKEPLSAGDRSLTLVIRTQQPIPDKPGVATELGRIVLEAGSDSTQRGEIVVWTADHRRPRFQAKGCTRVEPGETVPWSTNPRDVRSAAAAFRYWRQPAGLEAQIDTVPPVLSARTVHQVQMLEAGFAVSSEIHLDIAQAAVEIVELGWHADWKLDRQAPGTSPVEAVELAPERSLVRLRFWPPQRKPLKVKLESFVETKGSAATLVLPNTGRAYRAAGDSTGVPINFRGGEVRLQVPGELDVRMRPETSGLRAPGGRAPEPGVAWNGTVVLHQQLPDEKPAQLAIEWQPRVFDADAEAAVFVTTRRAHVRQILRYRFGSGTSPSVLRVRVPDEIAGEPSFRGEGLVDRPRRIEGRIWEVRIPRGLGGTYTLTIDYPLEHGDEPRVAIPFATPLQARVGQAAVRVWADARLRLEHHEASWHERMATLAWRTAPVPEPPPGTDAAWRPAALPPLPDVDEAPHLEVRGTRLEDPLKLRMEPAPESILADVVADRVLLEVDVTPDGRLAYRARFRLSRVRTASLSVDLPTAGRSFVLEEVSLRQVRTEASVALPVPAGERRALEVVKETAERGHTRLLVPVDPQLLFGPAVLEIRFTLGASEASTLAAVTELPAPTLGARAVIGRVRWRVEFPGGRLALGHTSAWRAEQVWQFNGWLQPPRPGAQVQELETWLSGTAIPIEGSPDSSLSYSGQGTLEPLRIVHVPHLAWLASCSFLVLAVGIGGYCASPRYRWVWIIAGIGVVLSLAIGIDALVVDATGASSLEAWAGPLGIHLLLAVVHGLQPGAGLLVGILVFWWLRQQRWRKRTVVLPGFTRIQSGSSLQRATATRPPVEPSTADGSRSAAPSPSELRV